MIIMIVEVLALFVFGTLVGNEIAVGVFVHPQLYRLAPSAHQAAARAIAAVYGRFAPIWYIASALLLIAVAALTLVPLAILATLIFLIMIIWTVMSLAPLNKKIANWDPAAPPPEWLEQRRRWDRGHMLRVVAIAIAFALLCLVVAAGVPTGVGTPTK